MIKTLRITGIIAVVSTVIFIVFPSVLGVRSNKQIEQFLSSAGAVEKFNAAKNDRAKDDQGRGSPLVKQAEAFALYLNPPPKPSPEKLAPQGPVVHRPVTVSPKFTLIGTSFYPLHPELSLALIDEPGKGLHWVRQGGKIGYLVIEQIKDKVVVARDGQQTFELVAERPPKRSLIKGQGQGTIGTNLSPQPPASGVVESAGRITQQVTAEGNSVVTSSTSPDIASLLDTPLFEELTNKISGIQARVESGEVNESVASAETIAVMDKIFADFNAMRVNAEEAKKLDSLGKKLKNDRNEPNRPAVDRARTLRRQGLSNRRRSGTPR